MVRVSVNGALAGSTDGFATWTATVALPTTRSRTALVVETEDDLGNTESRADSAMVVVEPRLFVRPEYLGLGTAGDVLYVTDRESIVAVDAVTGERSLVPGVLPSQPFGTAARGPGLLLVAAFAAGLIELDLVSGRRRVISDATHGTGAPACQFTHDVVVEGAGRSALMLCDGVNPVIVRVDLVTGHRTLVSDASRGAGPMLAVGYEMDLRGPREVVMTALLGDGSTVIVGIDLATGDRNVLFTELGAERGLALLGIAVDPVADAAWVVGDVVARIDLQTGIRTVVSSPTVGAGPNFQSPVGLVRRSDGALFVADPTLDAIFRVDARTGDRTLLSEQLVGTGPNGAISSLTWHPSTRELWATSMEGPRSFVSRLPSVVAIDRDSVVRRVVSNAQVGTGAPFASAPWTSLVCSVFDLQRARLLVYTNAGELIAVDRETGRRELVSARASGSAFTSMALSASGDRVVLAGYYSAEPVVATIDLASGAFAFVSGPIGAGPALTGPRAIVIDPSLPDTAFVIDASDTIMRVDLITGDRTVYSGVSVGVGPDLQNPLAAAIDPASGAIYVAQIGGNLESILRVRQGGDRTLVTGLAPGLARGVGPNLEYPTSMAFDPLAEQLIVLSFIRNAVVVVDVQSGARVILSK